MPNDKRLVIIDGFSLLFRAFYGTRYLSTSDGKPTNALFGFVSMLYTLFDTVKPDAVLVALDAPGKTFRHADYAEYKGTRRDTPEELSVQLGQARDLVNAFAIPVIELTGYEADDIVGTVSKWAEEHGYDTTIVTGDLDSLQLVDDCVHVMTTKRGVTDVVMYDPAAVNERYGFGPEFVPDYKALVGDTSDNIPGVPGIGDKSASILIQEFGTIENIIEKIDDVPEKFRKKIVGQEDQMRKSKWLATIVRDAPLEFHYLPFQISPEQIAACREYLTALEFRSHAKKLDQVLGRYIEGHADAVISVDAEAVEATLETGMFTYLELKKWIGDQPFAVLPHDDKAQKSMFDEGPDGQVFLAVGSTVRGTHFETAARLFLEKAPQAIGLQTKPFYRHGQNPHLTPPKFDVALAAYVLQSGRTSYEIGDIAMGYLDVAHPDTPEKQAVSMLLLEPVMRERLEKENQTQVFTDIELPLVPILAEMERYGITCSGDLLREFSKKLQTDIDQIQTKAWELAGHEFNIGSPKQIGEVLFDELSLPGGKKTKIGWATGAEILNELAPENEIVQEILNYRELTKLRSTYAEALPKMIADDGRIHTTYDQTVAATGRLSSNDPNLQNIPVRTELGRYIRKAFGPEPGWMLGSFDYSQIELRILAHMCQDENLVRAFQERVDVHAVTAALMFGLKEEDVTKEQRRLAKMLNYAVLYGVTGYGLANQLGAGFSVEDANRLIKQYNERFPAVKNFTEGMVEEARSKGFTVTLRGRRRYFPDIHAGNRQTRAYAERQAMNAPIQGTAADMIKLAMIDVRKALGDSPVRMLLQVHDELLFESPDGFDAIRESIRKDMEDALPLTVPVEVDGKFGQNWMEMSPV